MPNHHSGHGPSVLLDVRRLLGHDLSDIPPSGGHRTVKLFPRLVWWNPHGEHLVDEFAEPGLHLDGCLPLSFSAEPRLMVTSLILNMLPKLCHPFPADLPPLSLRRSAPEPNERIVS